MMLYEVATEGMVTQLTKQSGFEERLPSEVADEQHGLKDEKTKHSEDAKQ